MIGWSLVVVGCLDAPELIDPADPNGGDTGSGGDGDGDGETAPATIAFACPAGTPTFVQGLNTFTVKGHERSFFADFPPNASPTGSPDGSGTGGSGTTGTAGAASPVGVIFSWHGFAQEADAFRAEVGLRPDADPAHPVVIITPNDSGLLPPFGLDWNIVKGADNADLAMFESILGCLNAQYVIDGDAIYSFGFSAGSVMTSLVHASYPSLVRAVVAESGAWFDDPAEVALVRVPMPWDWPALPSASGSVLLTHGGPSDVTVLDILSLEDAAQAAFPFLAQRWRVVVDCAHDRGHALAPDVTPDLIVTFLTSHHGNAPSTGVGLPTSCMLRMP